MKKIVLSTLIGLFAIGFMAYVFPTEYRYTDAFVYNHKYKAKVKINRFTGETYALRNDGWAKVE